METRKVQTVGGGTYTVSLPKAWAEAQGLSTGDVVHLHAYLDGVLALQTCEEPADPLGSVTVPVDDAAPAAVERTLHAAYVAGFSKVVVEAATPLTDDQQRAIDRVVGSLSGATVAEQAPSRVTVRSLLEADEVSIRQSVRQLDYLARSMHEDATAALVDGTDPPPLADRHDQVARLTALVERHVVRGLSRLDEIDALGLSRSELFALWRAASTLDQVAARATDVAAAAEHDVASAPSLAADVGAVADAARAAVADAVAVVVGDADASVAHEARATLDTLEAEAEALDRRLFESNGSPYRLVRALDAARRTTDHGATTAAVGLRVALRRGEQTPTEAHSSD